MRALAIGIWISLQPPPDGYVTLWDLERFPSREMAVKNSQFALDHLGWLMKRRDNALSPDEREAYQEWYRDADLRRDVWLELCYATNPDNSAAYRRNKLRSLRRWLGQEAYEAGWMPCPVPIHRFEERR